MLNFLKNLIGFKEFDRYDAKPSPFAAPKRRMQQPESKLRDILDTGLKAKDVLIATEGNAIVLETTIVRTNKQVSQAIKEGYGTAITDTEIEEGAKRSVSITNLTLIKPYFILDWKATKIFREAKTEIPLTSIQRALAALTAANAKQLG